MAVSAEKINCNFVICSNYVWTSLCINGSYLYLNPNTNKMRSSAEAQPIRHNSFREAKGNLCQFLKRKPIEVQDEAATSIWSKNIKVYK